MKSVWLFRISAVILFLFGTLHTIGFLRFRPAAADGLAVWNAMNDVRFQEGNSVYTYANFYKGFGLFIALFLVFSAALAWHFANNAKDHPDSIRTIAWLFFLVQAGNVVLGAVYFGLPQITFAAVLAICTGLAAAWIPRIART